MKLSSIWQLETNPTKEIIDLLESVTLGTNGAKYRHLDTSERIHLADHPLFLTLQRNGRVMGNITFCRREKNWYIRYFAFSKALQGGGKTRTKGKSGFLKKEIESFFEGVLSGKMGEPVDRFYAYVDPKNLKSLWMTEQFGFHPIARIATQTYSRLRPKPSQKIEKSSDPEIIRSFLKQEFSDEAFFFSQQSERPPFYCLRDDETGEILAVAKITIANWQIERLPGTFGGFWTRVLPYLPIFRQLIHPKKYSFVVPEAVVVKENNVELLEEFFDGILAAENKKVVVWWVDEKQHLYREIKQKMKWGLLHRLLGVNYAEVVVREGKSATPISREAVFTSGFDFV